MIRVEADTAGLALAVRGHAGSGDPGRDLICAGVSALVLALREELLWLESRGQLSLDTLQLEPGLALIRCSAPPECRTGPETAFDTAVRGLRLLERLFGAYVQVLPRDSIHPHRAEGPGT